jgi:cell division protein FtsQ
MTVTTRVRGSSSVERFAARARSRRRLERRPLVYGAVAVVVVLASGWLVLFSPLLTVREVQVVGEQRVSARQVLRAAQVPLGVPLARLDVDAMRERIRGIRPVADVDVQRRPPHTVRLVITERVAAAVVRTPDGYQLVDATGVTFAGVGAPPRGVPVVVTRLVRPSARVLERATAVLVALPVEVRGTVTSVSADSPDDISLRLQKGIRVVWGGPEHSQLKAAVLGALMRRDAKVYDVSVPEAPVTRG